MKGSNNKNKYKVSYSALDAYINKTFRTILLLASSAALCAALFFTIQYLTGNMPGFDPAPIIFLDCIDVVFLLIALYFSKASVDETGIVQSDFLKVVKIIFCILIVFQWNFISYIFPARDFWGYLGFFILLVSFFFDYTLVDALSAALLVSIVISWYIRGDLLMPANGVDFVLNMGLRIVCIILTVFSLHLLAYCGNTLLVKELEKAVELDPLTGLLNRRRMRVHQQAIYDAAAAGAGHMSMAVIDIDNFKNINDTYSHNFGDIVLKRIAELIRENAGKDDIVFRWGGEEMLILSSDDKKTLIDRAEKIRELISETEITPEGKQPVRVTVTIGIACYREGIKLEDIFIAADKNLYIGKRGTKNIVIS